MKPKEILENIYNRSMKIVGSDDKITSDLDEDIIDHYVSLVEGDTALKFEHKKEWNNIVSQI